MLFQTSFQTNMVLFSSQKKIHFNYLMSHCSFPFHSFVHNAGFDTLEKQFYIWKTSLAQFVKHFPEISVFIWPLSLARCNVITLAGLVHLSELHGYPGKLQYRLCIL